MIRFLRIIIIVLLISLSLSFIFSKDGSGNDNAFNPDTFIPHPAIPDHIFFASNGGSPPPDQYIIIIDRGQPWSITNDTGWLVLSEPIRKDEINSRVDVSIDISNLEPGKYETEYVVTGDNGTSKGNVTLYISSVRVSFKDIENLLLFDNPIIHKIPNYPFSQSIADFNNDGNLDIAVINNKGKRKLGKKLLPYYDGKKKSSFLTIFLGDGKGTFKRKRQIKTGVNSVDMCTGDFNGDSIIDIAVANAGKIKPMRIEDRDETRGKFLFQSISIFYGKLTGEKIKFSKKKIKSVNLPINISSADLDLDGKDDLLVLDDSDNQVVFPTEDYDLDFSSNFNLKVFKATKNGFSIDRKFLNGFGTFLEVDLEANTFLRQIGLVVGDFDNDGDPDVISSKVKKYDFFIKNNLFFLENQGNGLFIKKKIALNNLGTHLVAGPMVMPGDFDNDGFADLISIKNTLLGMGRLFPGNGDGSFSVSSASMFLAGSNSEAKLRENMKMFVADLNGDDNLDFVFPSLRASTGLKDSQYSELIDKVGDWLIILFGEGDGNFFATHINFPQKDALKKVPRAVAGGDFNNDGMVDLSLLVDNKLAVFLQIK